MTTEDHDQYTEALLLHQVFWTVTPFVLVATPFLCAVALASMPGRKSLHYLMLAPTRSDTADAAPSSSKPLDAVVYLSDSTLSRLSTRSSDDLQC